MLKLKWGKKNTHTEFENLIQPYLEGLYRLAYRFSGNQHDAEDLIQDLLLKLYPRFSELTSIENPRSWMSRVLYNLFIDKQRQLSRTPAIASEQDPDLQPLEHQNWLSKPEDDLNNLLIQKHISKAMNSLNADQRSLIVLHDIEEFTLPELSAMLDTPVGTLKSRIHRARAKLREKLSKKTEPSEYEQRLSSNR